jgi:hydrogenase maturation protease
MHARIVCIGNGFLAADSAGQSVHEVLARMPLPDSVELIEGGTAGLRLLPALEGCDLVVFVDAVCGFLPAPGIITLEPADLHGPNDDLGHGAGLPALLAAARHVLDTPLPEIFIVGIEGQCDDSLRAEAALRCLSLTSGKKSAAGSFPHPASNQEAVDERERH